MVLCICWAIKRKEIVMKKKAFTLIELIIVIGIITILAGIISPSLHSILWRAKVTSMGISLSVLDSSLLSYYLEYRQYPGQADPTLMDTTKYGSGATVLVHGLFTDSTKDPDFPRDMWLEYGKTEIYDEQDDPAWGDREIIVDSLQSMAILYYPSRLGAKDFDQYVVDDNTTFWDGNWTDEDGAPKDFKDYISDYRFGPTLPVPKNSGRYILICAGEDGIYGTKDDITNFTAPAIRSIK